MLKSGRQSAMIYVKNRPTPARSLRCTAREAAIEAEAHADDHAGGESLRIQPQIRRRSFITLTDVRLESIVTWAARRSNQHPYSITSSARMSRL
jgi:hypothetical protein